MPPIAWQEEYALGIAEIDNQHRKIIEMINRLFKMASELTDDKILKDILMELSDYATYHFETEENYFKKFDYPGAAEHIAVHDQFRERIAELKKILDKGETEKVLFSLSTFLQNWWIWHINHVDRAYVPLFKKKGL